MKNYIEIIGIDKENLARKTGFSISKGKVKKYFNSLKKYNVESKDCDFLIDYYDTSGDLVDTVCITKGAFRTITGHEPPTSDEMIRIDEEYNSQF